MFDTSFRSDGRCSVQCESRDGDGRPAVRSKSGCWQREISPQWTLSWRNGSDSPNIGTLTGHERLGQPRRYGALGSTSSRFFGHGAQAALCQYTTELCLNARISILPAMRWLKRVCGCIPEDAQNLRQAIPIWSKQSTLLNSAEPPGAAEHTVPSSLNSRSSPSSRS
ncbi:hypothetical protein VTK26DRAFT_6904 [Humicola hyalothermophila]